MTDTSYLYEYFLAKSSEPKEEKEAGEDKAEEDKDSEK